MASAKPYQPPLNQIVQIQIRDLPGFVSGVITNFPTDQFVVRFPQHTQLPAAFVPGMEIQVKCADGAGLHVATTVVAELCLPPRPGIVVRMPSAFTLIQNRRFFRVEVDFPCTVQVLGPSGAPLATRMDDQARIRDISAGGARVQSTCHLAPGEHVQLEFLPQSEASKPHTTPTAGSPQISAKTPLTKPIRPIAVTPAAGVPQTCPLPTPKMQISAKVVRLIPNPADATEGALVGVEFERLSSRTQDRLVTLIFDVQRSQANRR